MKIMLATPPYDLMSKGYGSKRKLRGGFFPPLALGYLAAPLIQKGHEVRIMDCLPIKCGNEDVGAAVRDFQPDIIGISAVTANADEAHSLINYLKDNFNLPIVIGGPHANCFPEAVFRSAPRLDMLVSGEGERIFENVVDYYNENKQLPEDEPGTWRRLEDGRIVKNKLAEPVMNIDELLPPAHQLFDYKLYRPLPMQYKKLPVANLLTSRGCPWGRCTFCFESGRASQRYRRHSPERVVKEIGFLIKMNGIREIAFWDDNFLVNQDWVEKFCGLLDAEGIKMPWSAYGRVNTINQQMLARAAKSGLWSVFYGVETGNQDLLDRVKKGITLEQVTQAVRWCNELGIDTRGSFMMALPGETPEKAMKTIDFACQSGLTYAQFLPTHPEWGTELYDDAVKSGCLAPSYRGRTTPTYIPSGYKDAAEIKKMLHLAYRKFYFRPSYFLKHLKRLKSVDAIRQYYDAIKYIIGVSF